MTEQMWMGLIGLISTGLGVLSKWGYDRSKNGKYKPATPGTNGNGRKDIELAILRHQEDCPKAQTFEKLVERVDARLDALQRENQEHLKYHMEHKP